jgi:hypothetical protein
VASEIRKIPIYILLLVLFFGAIGTVLFGASVRHVLLGNVRLGKMGEAILIIAEFPSLTKQALEQLTQVTQALPNNFPELDGFKKSGKVPEGAKLDDGYLLLSSYDPSEKQATVQLIRISDQKHLHKWIPNIKELAALQKRKSEKYQPIVLEHFRIPDPLLLSDGKLVFHGNHSPLFKLGYCSNIEWSTDGYFHHTLEQDANGDFWVPSIIDPPTTSVSGGLQYRDDSIAKISSTGEVLFEKSVNKILKENGYMGLLAARFSYDHIHLNDIQPALTDSEFWEKGDLLLSLRNLNTILLYRPETDKIIWLKTGPWLNQHDGNFVGQSAISVFGNDMIFIGPDPFLQRKTTEILINGHNEIYRYDFKTDSITTPYSKMMKKLNVSTLTDGVVKFLANGDAFVEETLNGRILRLGPEQLKWEFVVKLEEDNLALLTWSRYLTAEQVQPILPKLQNSSCDQ